ncbi:MAG TPA: glycoside hydrolase family 5 protein [Kofleriaceae bacterium]|nr:glycoside hydrolase family 5 protein [Kofleriaceae bacterium]
MTTRIMLVLIAASAAACATELGDGGAFDDEDADASGDDGVVGDEDGDGDDGDPGGGAAPSSLFHVDGNRIVDATGATVRLTGINWFGLETASYAPHGLWQRSMTSMLDQVASLGFNVLRVPFSSQLFDAGSAPTGIDLSLNPELAGKTGPEVMDALVAAAGARGLRVILDRHRPGSDAQSPLWYTAAYSEERWIADWVALAARYRDNPTVIGFDLHNEPHGEATWGDGNAATDWRAAATRAGNAILAVHPDLLIFVEGVEQVGSDFYWWGGNLRGAATAKVELDVPGRVVYSPHEYPSSVYAQSWFQDPAYPNNLPGVWGASFGYLATGGAAPLLLGEFGTKYESDSDKQWLAALADYIGQNQLSFTYWSLNPNSGDTGGILEDDWLTVREDKMAVLAPILAPPLP